MTSKTFLWIEDRKGKASYIFWETLLRQLCPDIQVESKRNNSELVKAVKNIDDEDNKYIIMFDNSFDNLQVTTEQKILYQVMVPLLARNEEFRTIYDYYVTRVKNPLTRRQAMVAVSCKLIRVFYAVLTKGIDYDRFKMMLDIHRKSDVIAA